MGGRARELLRRVRRAGLSDLYRRLGRIESEASISLAMARQELRRLRARIGSLHAAHVRSLPDRIPLRRTEFKAFSQFGDDGILQYILGRIPAMDTFVEFGVEDYTEANTRFLLENDNWRGLILDEREDLAERPDIQDLFQRHELTVVSAFVTAENVDSLVAGAGCDGEIGLLSIDIDGNDYWVWRAIRSIRPQVVVIEYNAVFGPDRQVTIPYDPSFRREQAHHSWLYFGASLPALCQLGRSKGYAFVGCNSAGNNAYFVREELAQPFRVLDPKEGFVASRFRESRDEAGRRSALSGIERLRAISHLPVVDLDTGSRILLRELLPDP